MLHRLLACLLLALSPAASAAPVPAPAPVSGDRQALALDAHLAATRAPVPQAAAAEAWLAATAGGRQTAGAMDHVVGLSRLGWWVEASVHNADPVARERILVVRQPTLDEVLFGIACPDGTHRFAVNGDAHPFAVRDLPDRHPAFAFTIGPGQTCRLLVAVTSLETIQVPALLADTGTYVALQQRDNLLRGLALGVNLLFAAGALWLAFTSRRAAAWHFAAMVSSHFLLVLALAGIGFQFLWGDSPALQRVLSPLSIALAWLATGTFSAARVPATGRRGERVVRGVLLATYALAAAMTLLHVVRPDAMLVFALVTTVAAGLAALGLLNALAMLDGRHQARRVALATAVISVTALYESLGFLGVLPVGPHFLLVLQAGFLVQAALLLQAFRRDLAPAVPAAEHELRRRVAERTRELAGTVARLHAEKGELERLALTDALTGVSNRRFLDHALARMLPEAAARGVPVSLLLLDIDFFKQVNDRWGHPAGDCCLRQVAACIRAQLRLDQDLLCRYGGEEFAIVLPGTDREGALVVAEKIRAAVAASPFSDAEGLPHAVTVSLGIASLPGEPDPRRWLQAADGALYRAKAAGRNRCLAASA